MKFRKKPIVIDAYKVTEIDYDGFLMFGCFCNPPDWLSTATAKGQICTRGNMIYVETQTGDMRVTINDYIVCGADGELYPCKASIFERTHERVECD